MTSILLICAAGMTLAWLVAAQRKFAAHVARRFVRMPRFEQALLVVAVCVMTVCAQKSGVEKVKGGGGEWIESNISNAEVEEIGRRGEVADQNGRAESMTPPRDEEEISPVGRVIDATLPQANLSSATSNASMLRAKTSLTTNEVFDFSPPDGACLATNWLKRGAVTDFRSIRISGAFPFDGVDHSRLIVSASGEILLFPSRIKLKPFAAPLGIVPEANWGEKASQFWHKQLDDGTLLLTWQNALLNRAAKNPVSIQAELSPSGDVTYRYDLSRLASDALLTNVVVAADRPGHDFLTRRLEETRRRGVLFCERLVPDR